MTENHGLGLDRKDREVVNVETGGRISPGNFGTAGVVI